LADLSGRQSIEIAAPVERCYAVAADVERAPEWQGAMTSARVLERDEHGRPWLVESEIDALVAKLSLQLRFSYEEPTGLRWRRASGGLKGLEGCWAFEPLGPQATRATYAMDISLNRTLALLRKGVRGPAEAQVRRLLVDRPLRGLKEVAEGGP
jgi:ribosome-associated toxin RatA of RatAB toxin-antitoxin module